MEGAGSRVKRGRDLIVWKREDGYGRVEDAGVGWWVVRVGGWEKVLR
jgi:hypothetical protein